MPSNNGCLGKRPKEGALLLVDEHFLDDCFRMSAMPVKMLGVTYFRRVLAGLTAFFLCVHLKLLGNE